MVHLIEKDDQMEEAIVFLSKLPIMGIDTETSGLDPFTNKVLLIQCGNVYEQYVFDVARIGAGIARLKPIFEDPTKIKILHNAKFDYRFMKTNFGIEIENIFDTMLAEQLLQKGRKFSGFSLLDTANKYAGAKLDKSVRASFVNLVYGENFSQEQIEYAAEDVRYLEKIMSEERRLLSRDGLNKVVDIEMNVIQATADMELAGMKIDVVKWEAAEALAKVERGNAKDTLDAMLVFYTEADLFGNPGINYNSSKQLLTVLKKALPQEKIKSTNETDLKDINHPIIHALFAYRGMEKRVTTYGMPFLDNINPVTGRVHTTFEQLKTDTGRYSSKDPYKKGV